MKRLLHLILLMFCAMTTRCSLPFGGSDVIGGHPVPETESILPLQEGNRWVYRYTLFDSTGTKTDFPARELDLKVSRMFSLDSSRQLIRVSRSEWYDSTVQYVYGLEWDASDSGTLVSHRGTGPVELRGLYIEGTFRGSETYLLDTALLWYAYPVLTPGSWELNPPGGDDTAVISMECLTKNGTAWMYRHDDNSPSPLVFIDSCYVYLQTSGDETCYHTCHPEYGEIAFRHYTKGVLLESYVLVAAFLNK